MAERWVPEIMDQAGCFNYLWVYAANLLCNCGLVSQDPLSKASPNLSDLYRVCKSIVKDIAFGRINDLSYPTKPAEGGTVEDTITVTLEVGTGVVVQLASVATIRSRRSCRSGQMLVRFQS